MFNKDIIDFQKYPRKDFWKLVTDYAEECHKRVLVLWDKAGKQHLNKQEAIECLNCLFIDTHQRIKKYSSKLQEVYPTKQYTKNRLKQQQNLWWVDHFTAGISRWSTLNWFSSAKRKKKNGKTGYAGASAHFIIGYHDLPFYIIPVIHGAWHEPRRNKDSIGVEHVNCGKLTIGKDMKWYYWAGVLPPELVEELPPTPLDKPYRGCDVMQPYTQDQLINNITLKRIVSTALENTLEYPRMSQHTDWRRHKSDMGPLWPAEQCNAAAFNAIPIDQLDFVQDHDSYLERTEDLWTEKTDLENSTECDNPSYGNNVPTQDTDKDDDAGGIVDIKQVQKALTDLGHVLKTDGIMGIKTRKALKTFQRKWNTENTEMTLKVDGIPGPQTCAALMQSRKVHR